MSWLEKLENNVFSIKTGDGKTYTPLWKDSEKSKEYNTSTFDFIDVSGSFIERKKPKATKYPLIFWFQGDDNIEQTRAFEVSADDSRPWEVNHPFYGLIKGQPLSLNINDKAYNVSEISVDFWESITEDYPRDLVSVIDETATKNNVVLENSITSYSSNKAVFSSEDITKNKEANALTNSAFTSELQGDDYADYQVVYSTAQKSNDNLLNDPSLAITTCQQLLNYPSLLALPVVQKVKAYIDAFNNLKIELQSIADKLFFESQAGSCISNYCNASVNYLPTDYEISIDVFQVVQDLIDIYNDYLQILDDNSVSIYDVNNTWQPDADLQNSLYNLVMFTIGNLYNLAFDSKQERSFYTDKDTNLILLTHEYLCLDADDENIEKFRQTNNIKLDELFNIKKERLIKYYV